MSDFVGNEFLGAGEKVGLELWRIEDKLPVKHNDPDGKFFTGDSYILLSTTIKPNTIARVWSLHFWIGSETSTDEKGIAAYKTVELDDSLGGAAIQYREVQGFESALFLSYFKDVGVEYLPGGIASGFNHVDREQFSKRLLRIKGKRTIRVAEVPCESSSLNTGDCFILDLGRELFLYNGATANLQEKAKATGMALKIRDNMRSGKASIVIMDEDPSNATFWSELGGEVSVTDGGEDDTKSEAAALSSTKLFKISDESGDVVMTLVSEGKLERSALSTNDTFLLDCGDLTVWIGHDSSQNEKREGMLRATKYLTDNNLPPHTKINRIIEDAETSIFRSYFLQWNPPRKFDFTQSTVESSVAQVKPQEAIDYASLHARKVLAEKTVDDGTGEVKIWRIEDFEKVPVPLHLYGQFFGGDSYIVLYTYIDAHGTEEYIIYFWQGRQTSTDEKGSSALLAKALDGTLGGVSTQVRVVQGKEPAHFRAIFKGNMVVREGGIASGFRSSTVRESQMDESDPELYHVKGTNPGNTYGVHVPAASEHLVSSDCFILIIPGRSTTVWYGNGSNQAEQSSAHNIAEMLKTGTLTTVHEGSEDPSFWKVLGDKGDYPACRDEIEPAEPRLFQCSNVTGNFKVEEICNFAQEDLINDDVMLLDCYSTVFVWIGSNANKSERETSIETTQQYVLSAGDGRDVDSVSIIIIKAGHENALFTQHFGGWDEEVGKGNKFVDPYADKIALLKSTQVDGVTEGVADVAIVEEEEEEEEPLVISATSSSSAYTKTVAPGTKFSIDDLKNNLAEGIDSTKKEEYLSDADFVTVFGVTQAVFGGMPKWKQQAAKKSKGFF